MLVNITNRAILRANTINEAIFSIGFLTIMYTECDRMRAESEKINKNVFIYGFRFRKGRDFVSILCTFG